MGMAPLFVKYTTRSGNHYVFDAGTNEIVQIGKVVCRLLEDVGVLNAAEMLEKHRSVGEANVRDALAQLKEMQNRGVLCDHAPQRSIAAGRVISEGKEQSFGEFLRDHSRLLTLELTQECNLRCEYCCYGDYYPGRHTYEKATMSLEMAKKVIKDYLSHHPQKCRIGFYGGEPLLEFQLMKEIVYFVEEYVAQQGIGDAQFNISTNGTLLTDEVIHFFAAHRFHVMISLDGPKEVHDQYRVFRNDRHPGQKRGSYDVVMKGVKRFAELYPKYPGRGILVTLTATSDIEAIDDLLASLSSSYSLVMASTVRDVPANFRGEAKGAAPQYGCWTSRPCESGDCRRECHVSQTHQEDSKTPIDLATSHETSQSHKLPDFCNWTAESAHRYQSGTSRFNRELTESPDVQGLQAKYPVSRSMLVGGARDFHHRRITRGPLIATLAYRCFPGSTRTFCSADGKLYSCERTETGEVFRVGTADNGVDTDRALRLAEASRLLGDCGNCAAKRVCSLCASLMSEDKKSGRVDALAFQKTCQKTIHRLPAQLGTYTSMMETCRDHDVIDQIVQKGSDDDWLDDIEYVVTAEQLDMVEIGVEEIEEMV